MGAAMQVNEITEAVKVAQGTRWDEARLLERLVKLHLRLPYGEEAEILLPNRILDLSQSLRYSLAKFVVEAHADVAALAEALRAQS